MSSDPTKPWYLSWREDGNIHSGTQDATFASSTPRHDVVPPEWPAPDYCGRKRLHLPHTWGGEGWSAFRCRGVAK